MPPRIDERRLDAEWAADQEVLAELIENGDDPASLRTVDVSFVGTKSALAPLLEDFADLGFEFGQFVEADGQWRLDLDTEQTTEPDAIRALTRTCLEMEMRYPGIEYDGWGCVAQTGTQH